MLEPDIYNIYKQYYIQDLKFECCGFNYLKNTYILLPILIFLEGGGIKLYVGQQISQV